MSSNPELEIRLFRQETGERNVILTWSEWEFSKSIDGSSGTGTVTFHNTNDRIYDGIGRFRITRGDFLLFHLREAASGVEFFDDDAALQFIGRVESVADKFSEGQRIVELKIADATFSMLNNAFAFSGEGTSIELIEDIITDFTGDGSGNSLIIPSPTNWPSLRPDGSAFPTVRYASEKQVSTIIAELLQPTSTNTPSELESISPPAPQPYYYYVTPKYNESQPLNVQYELNILYPTDTADYIIDLRTDSFITVNIDDSNPERVTYVSWNAGWDLDNNSITGLYFNPFQLRDGRTIWRPFTEIAERRFEDEVRAGNIILVSSGGDLFRNDKRYNYASFPFTTSWGVNVANASAYKSAFKTIVESDANGVAQNYVTHKSFLSFVLELKGTLQYTPGNVVTLINTVGRVFTRRVTKVMHRYNTSNGWTTTLTLEEDRQPVGVVS